MSASKIISFLLHPVFSPVFTLFLVTQYIPTLFNGIGIYTTYLYLIVFLFTIMFPILTLLIMVKLKFVSSFYLEKLEERPVVISTTLIWFLIGYYFLFPVFQNFDILKYIYLGGSISLLVALIISKFWKISLHLLGIGNTIGIFLLLQAYSPKILFLIIILIGLSGLLGYSRLKEKAHTPKQVYFGFIIGALIQYSILWFFF